MRIEIRQAQVTELDAVARLFDDYGRFYRAASNLALATAFIGERLRGQDSVILMARDGDGVALGFTQLFPSFSSVGCTRMRPPSVSTTCGSDGPSGVTQALTVA